MIASCTRFAIFVIYEYDWDYTWVAAQMSIWTCVECSVYFISACLLMCRPLLNKITTWLPISSALRKLRSPYKNTFFNRGSRVKKSGSSSGNARNAGIRNSRSGGTGGTSRTAGPDEDELHIESQTWHSNNESVVESGLEGGIKV
jgi:hypothetical protein